MLNNLNRYDIVLGSNSPRRRELLADLGITFRVERIEGIDEHYPAHLPVSDIAQYLAMHKAQAHPKGDNELLITADTIVVLGDSVLGKPADVAEACQMLRALSGHTHQVTTGVCVATSERTESFSETTRVTFAPLTSDEIAYYVEHYRPLDKAGAYGIQEWIGNIGIIAIEGDFYNVMGLPTHHLYQVLKTF